MNTKPLLIFHLLTALFFGQKATACTNFIVTKGASADGSTMLVYTNDGEWLYNFSQTPAMDHKTGDSILFTSRYNVSGRIHQAPHTCAMIGFQMNEHQVSVGETTFVGREELWNKSGFLEYWHMMTLALERARTAREALKVMTSLAEQYTYASEGESFSITDPDEAWILEMVGTGTGGKGAVWVAMRIPDGMVAAHANHARIGEFPLNDPENCLYSKNVVSFAEKHGLYNPKTDGPFRFNEVYCPASPDRLKYCETRVWRLFTQAAPSLGLSPDYHRGVQGASRYPLWIKPDEKLTLSNVIDFIRDHYEGTPFDPGKDAEAGPFSNPYRNRPLGWLADSTHCSWERTISTANSAFSSIAQARGYLPDEVGGVVWFGVDDTWYTCYVPVYCNNTSVPESFMKGDLKKFSWDSAYWAFNFVSNYANLRYADMIVDIQAVQSELEGLVLHTRDSVEKKAMGMGKTDRINFLTNYSNSHGNTVYNRWLELGQFLLTRYNDGYIKDVNGNPQEVPYNDSYYRKALDGNRNRYTLPVWENSGKAEYTPY